MLDNSYLSVLNVMTGGTFDDSGNTVADSIEESELIKCNIKILNRKEIFDNNNQMIFITETVVYCDLKKLLILQSNLDLINQIYICDINKNNKKKYLVYRYDVQTITNSIKLMIEEKK